MWERPHQFRIGRLKFKAEYYHKRYRTVLSLKATLPYRSTGGDNRQISLPID